MRDSGPGRSARWGVAAIVAAIALLYAPSLAYPFVWDDVPLVLENPRLATPGALSIHDAFTSTTGGHWQPLTWGSYALDVAIAGGPDPRTMRCTNVGLHAVCALLVYVLATQLLARAGLGPAPWAAVAAAAAFALHPLRVESVVWITERRDVLSSALLLASTCAWLSARDRVGSARSAWLACALALHAMSMLAKAWGVVMPVVIASLVWMLERWRGRRVGAMNVVREATPFVAAAAPCAAAALWAQSRAGALSDVQALSIAGRLELAVRGAWFYLGKTFVPVGLAPLYERDPVDGGWTRWGLLALAALVAAGARAGGMRRGGPGGGRVPRVPRGGVAAAVTYLALLAPVSGLFQSGPQRAADRYSYLACVPVAIALAFAVSGASPRRQAACALAVGLMAGILTANQVSHWRDELALWTHAAAIEPDGILVLGNLGLAHHAQARACLAAGDFGGAADHFLLAQRHLARSRELAQRSRR